jgi:hypothetical protein
MLTLNVREQLQRVDALYPTRVARRRVPLARRRMGRYEVLLQLPHCVEVIVLAVAVQTVWASERSSCHPAAAARLFQTTCLLCFQSHACGPLSVPPGCGG